MSKAIAPADTKPDITALCSRAASGDSKALTELHQAMEQEPANWDSMGDLAALARHSLILALAGKNDVMAEAVGRKLKTMRKEIAGDAPSPLEALLVQRVVLGWLQVHYFETVYAQNLAELSPMQAEHHRRRITHAHNRYLKATRTLAVVRRLMKPVVAQVNIADKQINLVGSE